MKMDAYTITALVLIGFSAGLLGGFVGVGGGIIIVPALIYFMGMSQHMAIGTSVAVMLPPIGIGAALVYHQNGDINTPYAIVIALAFIIGGYLGGLASQSLKESVHVIKLVFGLVMLYSGGKMVFSALKVFLDK
jgi:uncharacterized protein